MDVQYWYMVLSSGSSWTPNVHDATHNKPCAQAAWDRLCMRFASNSTSFPDFNTKMCAKTLVYLGMRLK